MRTKYHYKYCKIFIDNGYFVPTITGTVSYNEILKLIEANPGISVSDISMKLRTKSSPSAALSFLRRMSLVRSKKDKNFVFYYCTNFYSRIKDETNKYQESINSILDGGIFSDT